MRVFAYGFAIVSMWTQPMRGAQPGRENPLSGLIIQHDDDSGYDLVEEIGLEASEVRNEALNRNRTNLEYISRRVIREPVHRGRIYPDFVDLLLELRLP